MSEDEESIDDYEEIIAHISYEVTINAFFNTTTTQFTYNKRVFDNIDIKNWSCPHCGCLIPVESNGMCWYIHDDRSGKKHFFVHCCREHAHKHINISTLRGSTNWCTKNYIYSLSELCLLKIESVTADEEESEFANIVSSLPFHFLKRLQNLRTINRQLKHFVHE